MPVFDLFEATLDGVFAVDRRQRIVFWNRAAREILGYEPDEVLGRHCYEVMRSVDGSGCAICRNRCTTVRASLRGELSPTRDVQVDTKDRGRLWINVTTFVLPSKWRELSLHAHVFRDTSEAKQIEARLEQTLGELNAPTEPGELRHPKEPLTERETEVLRLLAAGASTETVCARFDINASTARTHIQHVLQKLGVHSRLEAVTFAMRNGLLIPSAD